jgi:hypothetical protein
MEIICSQVAIQAAIVFQIYGLFFEKVALNPV